MSTITKAVRFALNCAVTLAFSTVLAATPTPNTHTITVNGQTQTYANLPGAPVGGDTSLAYQFRTRILSGKPGCQRFATEADDVFISEKIEGAAKVPLLKKIETDAGTAGCLAP